MNLKKVMIIIDNEIVTKDISYCKYNEVSHLYIVKYNNTDKYYNYSWDKIKVITKVSFINTKNFAFFLNNQFLDHISEVYEFDYYGTYYYHVIFDNKEFKDFDSLAFKKVNKENYEVLDYLRTVSEKTSLETAEGTKNLNRYMNDVSVDSLDSALALYLKLSKNYSNISSSSCLIFPFGCNSNQYVAVDNAINNKISVIEGPPGTGKTQTILNIIANIIIRNMTCQVVSNNNIAIMNIDEKLKKYNLNFFEAMLGRNENKESFFQNRVGSIPHFDDVHDLDITELALRVSNESVIVKRFYNAQNELARLKQRKNDLLLEYKYFQNLMANQSSNLVALKRLKINNLKLIWNELMNISKLSIWKKIKYIFFDGVGDLNFFNHEIQTILDSMQNQIYVSDLEELDEEINKRVKFIEENKESEKTFVNSSMKYFKKYLSIKYNDGKSIYTQKEMKKNCNKFVEDYPVILSTTYSSKNNIPKYLKFDYLIMDESSQVDVVTGTLALSSAKYAVIIGDEKQLSHVIDNKKRKVVDTIFSKYAIDKGYSYTLNNFLTSVKNIVSGVPVTMLKEHYRCHPKIINFCNKKFYNNELIIMSEDNGENDVIKVVKTVKGDHARNTSNQRQVDVILDELEKIKFEDIGIMTPYNKQVSLINSCLNAKYPDRELEALTVHKFQGKENDVIIYSTVDNDIGDFVANSNLLNVAISRAKRQFILIVSGEDIKNKNIRDFIDYVDYNNMEISTSKIYSVFDMLYKQYEEERLCFYKMHNKISNYDSENFVYYLIKRVVEEYEGLDFIFSQPLRSLIVDTSLLSEREKKYVSHHKTHIDFYIFNVITKKPVLAIEVDGYKYHKEGTEQYERDKLKDDILMKYNIPLVRLKTNGSEEEKVIRERLDKILENN